MKKQSGANLSLPPENSPRPDEIQAKDLVGPLVFFVDRSLGRRIIPGALRDAGEEVRVDEQSASQIRAFEARAVEGGTGEVGTSEVRAFEVCAAEVHPAQVYAAEVRASEINADI